MAVMMNRRSVLASAGALLLAGEARASNASVVIDVDTAAAPECAAWATTAAKLAKGWWPTITARLASPGFQAPDRVRLVVKPAEGVASTTANGITVNSRYIADHPADTGLVAHELVHVVQAYPSPDPGWLTEGIADYMRYYVLLPDDPKRAFDKTKRDWRGGYQPSAALLDFAERKFSTKPIEQVNAAMRRGGDGEAAFRSATGTTPEALWQDYLKA